MSLLAIHDLTPHDRELLGLADDLARTFERHAGEGDRTATTPPAAIAALRASGYPALTVPARYSGRGASLYQFALTQARLGQADASLALIAAMNGHVLGALGEAGGWPDELYARVAAEVVERGALINSLATEPELGSPSRGGLPRTHAERTREGWRLSGRKTFSTGAPALDYMQVTAAVGDQVWRFLVPARAEGVRVEPTWQGALALRASASHDVLFDAVALPADHAIPPREERSPASSAWFWTAIAATYLGVGEGALGALVRYARERVPTALGQPIATLDKIQQAVGRIELELAAAQATLHRATRAWTARPEARAQLLGAIAGAKYACTNAAVSAADQAMRAAGGAALSTDLPLERYFRDTRAGLVHPPADDAALALVGRARLEQPDGEGT